MTTRLRSMLRAILIEVRRFAYLRGSSTLAPTCDIREYGADGFDTFFGYHDVTPFGPNDRLLLSARCAKRKDSRAAGTPLELGVFDLSYAQPRFERIAVTSAWCWQQGCRLQWFGSTSENYVLFNDTERGRHISRLIDVVAAKSVAAFPRALYAINKDGTLGVSLNFARLQRLRPGYGYDDISDLSSGECAPMDDGLWLVDLKRGSDELILSLAEVAAIRPEPSMADATHYFNHVLWSPDGSRFFFLHLWRLANGKRKSRAFIWNVATTRLFLLSPSDYVSHFCWIDNQRMIIYSNELHSGTHYHLYDVDKGCIGVVGSRNLCEDGHPSMSPANPTLMVTDTYPNRLGEQSLFIFDIASEQLGKVASLYSPSRLRGEIRCDLHPRWSRDGRTICVDSAHRGERRICLIGGNLTDTLSI